MPSLLAAILILALGYYGLKLFASASPVLLARLVKRGGGLLALAFAAFILLRGNLEVGLALGGLGLWLLGWSAPPGWSKYFRTMGGAASGSTGSSRVRSAMIEMELDHASGAMSGAVLAGVHEGKPLAHLSRAQCEELYSACLADDPDGARLLEAYLDRRFPGWAAAGNTRGDAGHGNERARSAAKMSEDEAYEVLGLKKGAGREDVTRAHRALMKKLHPDHGGTTSLAARVNEAKEVLLRRHNS
jgi:hypothetical protein